MHLKNVILVTIVIACASCNSTKKSKSVFGQASSFHASVPKNTGDGLSCNTAILITETSETNGVAAEYAWIREHYKNYKSKGQALTTKDKKPYDVITIELSDGSELKLYFDISNFFGKF